MMSADKSELARLIEEQQEVQASNPPSSKAWQEASERIHELAERMTGKPAQDAWGKKN